MKEQGRLSLVIWFQVIEGRDEERCDDGREQRGLQTVSVRSESMTSPNDLAHENDWCIQFLIPLRQTHFIVLHRNSVVNGPDLWVDITEYICRFKIGYRGGRGSSG